VPGAQAVRRSWTCSEVRLAAGVRRLDFSAELAPAAVERLVREADGYQPHLVAPEMGYRRLLQACLAKFKVSTR